MRLLGKILMAALAMSSINAYAADNIACLESTAFYEANTEGFEAMLAVASVVMNRAGSIKNVCKEVKKANQFSWVGKKTIKRIDKARPVAQLVQSGFVHPKFKNATHFHDTSIKPSWTKDMVYVGKIKKLKFYREDSNKGF